MFKGSWIGLQAWPPQTGSEHCRVVPGPAAERTRFYSRADVGSAISPNLPLSLLQDRASNLHYTFVLLPVLPPLLFFCLIFSTTPPQIVSLDLEASVPAPSPLSSFSSSLHLKQLQKGQIYYHPELVSPLFSQLERSWMCTV